MQLTANFAILASAIALSMIPSVFALPINGNVESQLAARNVEYLDINARDVAEFDAREVDDLEFTARELIGQYHEAREYYDELDARAYSNELDVRSYLEDLEIDARDFYEYIMARSASDADFQKVHTEKKTEVNTIAEKITAAMAATIEKDIPDFRAVWETIKQENTALKAEKGFTVPHRSPEQAKKSLSDKEKRLKHLKIIAKDGVAYTSQKKLELGKAIAAEKEYQTKHAANVANKPKKTDSQQPQPPSPQPQPAQPAVPPKLARRRS